MPSNTPPPRKRRKVQAMAAAVLEQCTICIEENLHSAGLALMTSSLIAGSDVGAPASMPPAQHLSLASTLALHPSFTTRTDAIDRHEVARAAMSYLRHAAAMVDLDSGLKDAFKFRGTLDRKERTKRAISRQYGVTGADDDEDVSQIRSQYAQKQSLAENAEDFWAVVGWAFNCSVKRKARWERWRLWLDLVLDIMQADLDESAPEEMELRKRADLSGTLIAHYLASHGTGRQNNRRVMRAIVADGSTQSIAQFPEIWKDETRSPKKKKDDRLSKKRKLDLDNEEYGDYFDNDSGEESSGGRSRRPATAALQMSRRSASPSPTRCGNEGDSSDDELEAESASRGVDRFGGAESVRIRQRFLGLLARFSRAAPTLFVDTEELFALYTEFVRPLPLSIFQQFVLPIQPYLNPDLHASLVEMLLRPLIGSSSCQGLIDQQELENSFATRTATNTTATDNAKVSLLTESLLRALWQSDSLDSDLSRLRKRIEEGVQARTEKIASDGRKKVGKRSVADEEARVTIQCSAERMNLLLTVLAG